MLELCVIVLLGYISMNLLYIVYILMDKISEVCRIYDCNEFDELFESFPSVLLLLLLYSKKYSFKRV